MKKNTNKTFKKISEQAVLTTKQSRRVAGGETLTVTKAILPVKQNATVETDTYTVNLEPVEKDEGKV